MKIIDRQIFYADEWLLEEDGYRNVFTDEYLDAEEFETNLIVG